MDGVYDLGGMAGFGRVDVEPDEPTFHEPWEQTAFRLLMGSIGLLRAFGADEYRHAVERMAPVHYLDAPYYERTLTGVATLLVEKGFLDPSDLEARAGGSFPLGRAVRPNRDDGRKARAAPRFSVGSRVRVRDDHQPGHTRAPRYVRGRHGVVTHVTRPFPYPDARAHGLPDRSESTYHVEFSAGELWGEDGEANATVLVDLWESYLEPREGR
jgi:nitrile hydratase